MRYSYTDKLIDCCLSAGIVDVLRVISLVRGQCSSKGNHDAKVHLKMANG